MAMRVPKPRRTRTRALRADGSVEILPTHEITSNMCRFVLDRNEDVSGVSGTGLVAEGVCFSDGAVALRWTGEHVSTAIYDSVRDVIAVHGHENKTQLRWIDG